MKYVILQGQHNFVTTFKNVHLDVLHVNCNMFRFYVCEKSFRYGTLNFATLCNSAHHNGIESIFERICTCKNLSISLVCFGTACLRRGSCELRDGERSGTARTLPSKNIKVCMFTRQQVRVEPLARVVQRGRLSSRHTDVWQYRANQLYRSELFALGPSVFCGV